MKRMLVLACLLCAPVLWAQELTAVYVEGWVDRKTRAGTLEELFLGDVLGAGEGVVTGADGFAELEMEGGTAVRVGPNSVFMVEEMPAEEGKATGFAALVGEVGYKFGAFTGAEPPVRTQSAVAGVRGTEFVVYAGEDGSSVIAVSKGVVEVEAQGERVVLREGEAVEVPFGAPPSEKFSYHGKPLDFSTWNAERLEAMLADPVAALRRVRDQIASFMDKADLLKEEQERIRAEVEGLGEEYERIKQEQGLDAAQAFRRERIDPLTVQAAYLGFNYRYYALSALSMRRFVVARLYVPLRTRAFAGGGVEWQAFLEAYRSFLAFFEERVVPYLVEADI